MTTHRRRGQRPQHYVRQSRGVGFGLLIYLILAIVVVTLVGRYMPHVANRVGHIEHGFLRFGIYFSGYAALACVGVWLAHRLPLRLRPENALRLSFIVATTLSVAVAFYQNRFGTGLSATYFTVGVLGAFVGILLVTQAYFGLVEINAPPSAAVIAEVLDAHRAVPLVSDAWDRVKRPLELVLALALIVLTLPISILLAMMIWLQDPGPLFVTKIAVTRGGRSFHLFKLRSMIKDAERGTGVVPAAPDDTRVTPLGRLLRRTHIDELPQMINIALGDMSLVGPRPDRTVIAHRNLVTLPHYARRHVIRPGLAGLAAVRGDYYSTPREKLRYDLLYIRRRSFGLDARIFFGATLAAFTGVSPGAERGRKRYLQRHQQERYRRAYLALHGGEPNCEEGAACAPAASLGPSLLPLSLRQ